MFTPVTGSPFANGTTVAGVTFSPSGVLLATAHRSFDSVVVFSVGAGGVLTPAGSAALAANAHPSWVAFSPTNGLLASANDNGTASVFSVSAGGAVTVTGSATIGAGTHPSSVAFSPSGGLLATANAGDDSVSVFSVSTGGALTPAGSATLAAGAAPSSIAFSPSGGLLATASRGNGTVSVLSVSEGGLLTPAGSTTIGAGTNPSSVAFSPSGGLLATANRGTGTVSVFSVSAGGSLTQVSGSPDAVGDAQAVAFSQHGGLLAVARSSEENSVAVFSVTTGGALTQVAGSPYPTDGGTFAVALSPDGHLLATANSFINNLSVFRGGAPDVQISAPTDQQTYTQSQSVSTTFACTDPPGAGGISSCIDSHGASSPTGTLDTSILGAHTYTATAASNDGLTTSSAVSYMVTAAPPATTTTTTATPPAPPATPIPTACPRPSGRVSGIALGPVSLGMTRPGVRGQLPHFNITQNDFDNFCLAGGWGIRAGYPSAKLLRSLPQSTRTAASGRVVLVLSSNRYYALRGIRPGATQRAAAKVLHPGVVMHVGLNDWYMAPNGSATAVLKVRHGTVREIGVATKTMTRDQSTQLTFVRSFS